MRKKKCFMEMKNKIDSLARHDESSNDLHSDHEDRLNKIEENQRACDAKLERQSGYLRLMLNHLKITYPKEK